MDPSNANTTTKSFVGPTPVDYTNADLYMFERQKLMYFNFFLKHMPHIYSYVDVQIMADHNIAPNNELPFNRRIYVNLLATPKFCQQIHCQTNYPRGQTCTKETEPLVFKSGNTDISACQAGCFNLYDNSFATNPDMKGDDLRGPFTLWSDRMECCQYHNNQPFALAIDDFLRTDEHITPRVDTIGTGFDMSDELGIDADNNETFRFHMNRYYCDDFKLKFDGVKCEPTWGETIFSAVVSKTLYKACQYGVRYAKTGVKANAVNKPDVPPITSPPPSSYNEWLMDVNPKAVFIDPDISLDTLGITEANSNMMWTTEFGWPGRLVEPIGDGIKSSPNSNVPPTKKNNTSRSKASKKKPFVSQSVEKDNIIERRKKKTTTSTEKRSKSISHKNELTITKNKKNKSESDASLSDENTNNHVNSEIILPTVSLSLKATNTNSYVRRTAEYRHLGVEGDIGHRKQIIKRDYAQLNKHRPPQLHIDVMTGRRLTDSYELLGIYKTIKNNAALNSTVYDLGPQAVHRDLTAQFRNAVHAIATLDPETVIGFAGNYASLFGSQFAKNLSNLAIHLESTVVTQTIMTLAKRATIHSMIPMTTLATVNVLSSMMRLFAGCLRTGLVIIDIIGLIEFFLGFKDFFGLGALSDQGMVDTYSNMDLEYNFINFGYRTVEMSPIQVMTVMENLNMPELFLSRNTEAPGLSKLYLMARSGERKIRRYELPIEKVVTYNDFPTTVKWSSEYLYALKYNSNKLKIDWTTDVILHNVEDTESIINTVVEQLDFSNLEIHKEYSKDFIWRIKYLHILLPCSLIVVCLAASGLYVFACIVLILLAFMVNYSVFSENKIFSGQT